MVEEMSGRGWELVTSDEPTIVAKLLLDAMVMKNGQSDGCLADSTGTNESDRGEILCETNDLLDQVITPETGPRCRGR